MTSNENLTLFNESWKLGQGTMNHVRWTWTPYNNSIHYNHKERYTCSRKNVIQMAHVSDKAVQIICK